MVSLEHRASREREVRRETWGHRGCPCQVPLAALGLLVPRDHQVSPDLQAIPQDKTASLENPGVLVCREREVTQERRARKVRDAGKF